MIKVEISMRGELYTQELKEGATGRDLKNKFNLPALYYLGGRQLDSELRLKDGDKIEIVFVFGGG
ncbi:MAG: hypothetical protein A4E57_02876 [Syntrophorhabdaceae bacterium PtaU1.Bin034]|nr:MAG: hypothetical protein A4E57_02876 [Syntrophorhabdaceae bacterium PtaU1.Bin034]